MSEAVTVPSLIMMTLIVSEESFAARAGQTHWLRHTLDTDILRQTDSHRRQTDKHTHTHRQTRGRLF